MLRRAGDLGVAQVPYIKKSEMKYGRPPDLIKNQPPIFLCRSFGWRNFFAISVIDISARLASCRVFSVGGLRGFCIGLHVLIGLMPYLITSKNAFFDFFLLPLQTKNKIVVMIE